MINRLVLLLTLIASGCAIEEADFPDVYADAICDRLAECDKGDYENRYESDEDCEEQWADGADFWMDAADLLGGEYDSEDARDCIRAIRGADCGEFESGDYECDLY